MKKSVLCLRCAFNQICVNQSLKSLYIFVTDDALSLIIRTQENKEIAANQLTQTGAPSFNSHILPDLFLRLLQVLTIITVRYGSLCGKPTARLPDHCVSQLLRKTDIFLTLIS